LQNAAFCPISAQAQILTRLRRINPQNTQCIPGVNPAIAGSIFQGLKMAIAVLSLRSLGREFYTV
jgi:hypothetical protein